MKKVRTSKTDCDDKKLEGRYANYFKVGHNASEFLFDFGQFYSENGEGDIYIRIVTSPVYAKSFLEVLRQSVEQYERSFGRILEKNK
ncbi:DUF3467 domain-containing protein [Desulfonema magnum]|uniref:DUF3467 n=1 Tax=Desulfonema magnum TaxID=45655 RepID=A0A975BRM1_9BACT|nr:DUF3467 domain-containing protein [Desulfonema magnum]QTA90167.1 DUF3467 [Desulfonema magnum]